MNIFNSKAKGKKKRSIMKAIGKEVYNTTSALKSNIPLFGPVLEIMDLIIEAYDDVQINKKVCRVLVDRVHNVKTCVKRLGRQIKEDKDNFCNEDYYEAFHRLEETMKDIKNFISEVSNYSIERIHFRKDVKEDCEDLLKRLEYNCDDLQLGIIISDTDRQREQLDLMRGLKDYLEVGN